MLRLAVLILMIILASVGIGITGAAPIFGGKREPFLNKEINVEQVAEKEDDEEGDLKEIG